MAGLPGLPTIEEVNGSSVGDPEEAVVQPVPEQQFQTPRIKVSKETLDRASQSELVALANMMQDQDLAGSGDSNLERAGNARIAANSSREVTNTTLGEAQLGAGFKRNEDTGTVSELDDLRLRLGTPRADGNFEELKSRILNRFPGSTVEELAVPVGRSSVAIRLPGQEQFSVLDSKDEFTWSDLADLLGSVVNLETAASIIGASVTAGLSFPLRAAGLAFSGGFGSLLDEGFDTLRGFQDETFEEVFKFDVLPAAAAGAAGEVLTVPFRKAANLATMRGNVNLTPDEKTAIRTFKDAGVEGPSIGSVVPSVGALQRQAQATSKDELDLALKEMTQGLDDLKKMKETISQGGSNLSDKDLDAIAESSVSAMRDVVNTFPEVSREQGGRALKAARKEFETIWRSRIGNKYTKASQSAEDAFFDASQAIEDANNILKGVTAKKKAPKQQITLPGGDKIDIPQGMSVPGLDAEIEPIQLQELSADFALKLKKLTSLDPEVGAFEGNSAFEQLKELRTGFFDLKTPKPGERPTNENRLAGVIWNSLKDVIENPKNASEEFRIFLKQANLTNQRFERILEITDVSNIAKNTEPGKLVDLIEPGKAFTLRTMRRVMPAKDFSKFTSSWKTKLLRDPQGLRSAIEKFKSDPEALAVVMSPEEKINFLRFGDDVAKIEKELSVVRNSNLGMNKRASELINSGNVDTLGVLVNNSGGKESKFGKSLRAAVIDVVILSSEKVTKGTRGVGPREAISAIARLEKNGILDAVMLPQEKEALRNRELMFSLFRDPVDTGAGLQAASLAADVGAIADPVALATDTGKTFSKSLSGLSGFAKNYYIGKILKNKLLRRVVLGAGEEGDVDLTAIRAIAAVTSEVLVAATKESRVAKAEKENNQ